MKTKDIIYIGIMAALMGLCAWISIPTVVPVTLQTAAVFLAMGLLGGKKGTLAVAVYLLLGAVGVPVFAGFTGGMGVLFGMTGGYLLGFLLTALVMWAAECLWGKSTAVWWISALLGLALCYLFGSLWFYLLYTRANGSVELFLVLQWCVLPFIIPDLVKLALAFALKRRLSKVLS